MTPEDAIRQIAEGFRALGFETFLSMTSVGVRSSARVVTIQIPRRHADLGGGYGRASLKVTGPVDASIRITAASAPPASSPPES